MIHTHVDVTRHTLTLSTRAEVAVDRKSFSTRRADSNPNGGLIWELQHIHGNRLQVVAPLVVKPWGVNSDTPTAAGKFFPGLVDT